MKQARGVWGSDPGVVTCRILKFKLQRRGIMKDGINVGFGSITEDVQTCVRGRWDVW